MTGFINYDTALQVANDVYGGAAHLPDGWTLDLTFNGTKTPGVLALPNGFYAYELKPAGIDNGVRILAFRGTDASSESNLITTVFADLTDVGKAQFADA